MVQSAPLQRLADRLGVLTTLRDGLGATRQVSDETLARVCASLGAPIASPTEAASALDWLASGDADSRLPPVLVAWDGELEAIPARPGDEALLTHEGGSELPLVRDGEFVRPAERLPWGYHRLTVSRRRVARHAVIIAAPTRSWRPTPYRREWGIGTHLAALRTARSRSIGDLQDLESTCRWIGRHGGRVVTVLPLLPTFNDEPPEPSPYAPVSRLFWSELILDLGEHHRTTPPPDRLDVVRAASEVSEALGRMPLEPAAARDPELRRYAAFRGAQARLGRNWRAWPAAARAGVLDDRVVDPVVEALHLKGQWQVRQQLTGMRHRLDACGVALGLDLAVGVHPDGYDPWSRPGLFADAMSVGAPPDPGFPSGQDWGFPPVLPSASRAEGHAYLAAAIRHQARLAGVLRFDHVMAFRRLYWIPQGMDLDQGTYVTWPAEELFAIATLESHRQRCELVGENLGTVPTEMNAALKRHDIRGLYLAEFSAHDDPVPPPAPWEVALIGSHDTPPLAGWMAGTDIPERRTHGLLSDRGAMEAQLEREAAITRLAATLDVGPDDPAAMLEALLHWLGRSASPLVIPWLEDLWLERRGVNLPGTRSSEHPDWQRPMDRLLDQVIEDQTIGARLALLDVARRVGGG